MVECPTSAAIAPQVANNRHVFGVMLPSFLKGGAQVCAASPTNSQHMKTRRSRHLFILEHAPYKRSPTGTTVVGAAAERRVTGVRHECHRAVYGLADHGCTRAPPQNVDVAQHFGSAALLMLSAFLWPCARRRISARAGRTQWPRHFRRRTAPGSGTCTAAEPIDES